MEKFDVIIIGAGPAGYVAAIRCAQLGMRTGCVEQWLAPDGKAALGGTCLNVGCIPSKALLDSSHHFEHISKHAKDHGIEVGSVAIDIGKMQARKDKVVKTLTTGIAGLFKKNGVEWLKGSGRLAGPGQVEVLPADGGDAMTVETTHIVIATGSVPATIPPAPVDQDLVVDSTGALSFDTVPERLGVIGAGVIGLELGSVWRRLGSAVTIFEALPEFLTLADRDVAKETSKVMKRQGLDIRLNAKVTATRTSAGKVEVDVASGDSVETHEFDRLIVAVGRRPNTGALGAEEAGLELDPRGFIVVDDECRTALPNVYAVGDCVRGPMLAHKASEEGIAVAERIAGQKPHVDFNHVPWVIYTWPEIAWVGQTEQELEAEGRDIEIGKFPFIASGRARAMGETDGFIKLIADADSDAVLGVHIIGPNASELIAEAALGMAFGASAEDIARTCHAHPTLAESMHEAALGADGREIHA